MKACFIGHRTIDKTERLCLLLKQTIEMLIKKGVNVFLLVVKVRLTIYRGKLLVS